MPSKVKKPEGYEGWRTVSEVGEFLGVSTRTVERWYSKGEMPEPFRTPEGVKLWDPEACETMLQARLGRLPSEMARKRRITRA